MAEVIRMPKLSDTMTEGVVASWLKKVGDKVKSGDILAEIETDKATMEFESYADGVLLHIGVQKGQAAPVDSLLAIIGKEGEDVSALVKEGAAPAKKEEVKEENAAEEEKEEKEEKKEPEVVGTEATAKTAPSAEPRSTPAPAMAGASSTTNGRLKASPLAKRLARDKNLDLSRLRGTGDEGRIVKRDVETFQGGMAPGYVGTEQFSEVAVSQMRKTIAKRLAESKFSAPHFYLTLEIDMERAINVREMINAQIEPDKISYNDLVIKAVAHALRQHPKVNSSWLGDRIRYNEHIHIGVAVAVEEGLLVPVVRFADGKTLRQIGAEVREYAKRAKEKKLQPQDWEGNTFTISNLGMFGIEEFTAIINPPDACILAVGGIMEKPVVKNGRIVPGFTMKVTLSCDHRVVDGATGAAFLQTLKGALEEPVLFLGVGAM